MKTKITILLFFILPLWSVKAQFSPFESGKTVTANFGSFSSGAIFKDGFNIGIKATFSFTNGVYIAPEIFYFPNLRGNDYFHTGVTAGYNFIHTEKSRLHGGILINRITRSPNTQNAGPNGSLGFNFGYEYTISTWGVYIGAWINRQFRTDTAPRENNYWRTSLFLEIGVKIF